MKGIVTSKELPPQNNVEKREEKEKGNWKTVTRDRKRAVQPRSLSATRCSEVRSDEKGCGEVGKRLEVEEEKVQRPDVEEQVKRSEMEKDKDVGRLEMEKDEDVGRLEMEKDKDVGRLEMEEERVPRRSDTEKGNGKEEVQTRAEGQETGDAKVYSNHHGMGGACTLVNAFSFFLQQLSWSDIVAEYDGNSSPVLSHVPMLTHTLPSRSWREQSTNHVLG